MSLFELNLIERRVMNYVTQLHLLITAGRLSKQLSSLLTGPISGVRSIGS
jgi:hypothetical protein